MRVEQRKLQPTRPVAARLLQSEHHGERVRSTARPAIHWTRMHIGPIAFRLRPTDDEEAVFAKLAVALRRERELRVAAVWLADLPKQHRGIRRLQGRHGEEDEKCPGARDQACGGRRE